MPFAIAARFLMDTYQGADSAGVSETYPSAERLYKALVATAYGVFGFHAGQTDNESALTDDQINDALHWLESNPPDAIRLPYRIRRNVSSAIVFRKRGSVMKQSEKYETKSNKAAQFTAYVDGEQGELIWQWEHGPESSDTRATLAALAYEVPYLGEACSPVRLTVLSKPSDFPEGYPFDKDHTWTRVDADSMFTSTRPVQEFQAPDEGHLAELQAGYAAAYPKKLSDSSKKPPQWGTERIPMPNTLTVRTRYIAYAEPESDEPANRIVHPWNLGFFIPALMVGDDASQSDGVVDDWTPQPSSLVAWCVALHRLLVRTWGYGASPMLTGRYAMKSVERPANNVAIQVLTARERELVDESLRDQLPGFLLMLPHDMPQDEVNALADVCASLQGQRLYYGSGQGTLQLGQADTTVDVDAVWRPVQPGCRRLWVPYPMCVSETRPIPDPDGSHGKWTAAQGVALAIAHVWRDVIAGQLPDRRHEELKSSVRRNWQYWDQAECVLNGQNRVRVYGAHGTYRSQMSDYVHKTQPNTLITGLSAQIAFDEAWNVERTALAIGQSRHMGGGLLLPVDVPDQLFDEKGNLLWMR
ncbi:CRISPR-associated protein [Bifidobacterium sp. DSM 109958]|uniref:CRISPR-associated protein n=1 Tax=Bifidobacterium moraviense TaxID=2675323 RepID=A0A7Y0HXX8_9BIFI|nr:type I-U CRISPR-associated protein Csb2 [Bifidobacterium sp. DSM 109958]NMN00681.1 CRISPR-associated protein [Bifidobacterium sp. DSM 109958]